MKHLTIILLLFLSLTATLLSGAFLDYFHARSDGNNITLEWKTQSETGVQAFEVQRKAGTNGEYISISTIDPKGSNSYYTFIDRSAFKSLFPLTLCDMSTKYKYCSFIEGALNPLLQLALTEIVLHGL